MPILPVRQCACQLQTLFGLFAGPAKIAIQPNIDGMYSQRLRPQKVILGIALQKLPQPISCLRIIVPLPKSPGDRNNSQTGFDICRQCPIRSRAEIIELIIQFIEPEHLIGTIELRLGLSKPVLQNKPGAYPRIF